MKKILLLLLLGLFLCGCAVTPETPYVPTGDALDWDNATQPTETEPTEQELILMYYPQRSMNPLLSTDYTNRTLFSLLYQGLFSVDSNYVAHPVLCDSYSVSADTRVYTFYVANATFSDNTPVTPEDVYATLDYARDCPIYAGRFQHVYQMELTEDGGIRFRLDTPMETFPLLLDVPILKASQLEEDFPLGTGPYQYEQTHAGARLRQCRDWWCDARLPITATSIPLLEAESPTQIRDSFELANVGLVCADPSSND